MIKESENKVVTPFVSAAESKARAAKAVQTSEDIHVGPNTQLSGGFNTNGMMIVDGRVESGDIAADRLIISHIGNLEGKAVVHRAEISGVFNGDMVAGDEVIVRPTAKIAGTVRCQKLVIHRGARIECMFSCTADQDAETPQAVKEGLPQRLQWLHQTMGTARDRRLILTGAGSVFAFMGFVGMLVGLKMVLS